MLKETLHFLRHAPDTLALKSRLPQEELYDTLMQRSEAAGMGEKRRLLVQDLQGEVLEIGCGTGLMFPHYSPGVHLTGIEMDEAFLALARQRARDLGLNATLLSGRAEALPLPAASVDHVVVGLVLCSVAHVGKVLGEIRRVLRPGGAVHLIEHVKSPSPVSGFFMDVFDPFWLALNGQGCHMNRDTEALLRQAGYHVTESGPFQLFAPGMPAFPMLLMRAVPI